MDVGLLAFLALGFLGSFHCAGMCGGFALAVALASGDARRRLVLDQTSFAGGKALTYVVLGLALRTLVSGAIDASGLSLAQRVASVLAGLVLVAGGLKLWGLALPGTGGGAGRRLVAAFGRAQSAARALGGPTGAFAAGALTGFLPCGLSWSAFALATQVDVATAVPGLFLFGLATSPALALTALGGRRLAALAPGRRIAGARLAGALLVAFGAITALRGGWTAEEALAGEPAPCCEPGE